MSRTGWLALLAGLLFVAGCGGPKPAPEARVTVGSTPPGADVLVAGAKVGRTPFDLSVKGEANVVLEMDGYVRQAVLVRADGPPRIDVALVAAPRLAAPAPKAEGKASAQAGGGGFATLRDANKAYRAGEIDRVEYDRIAHRFKARYNSEIADLKQAYRKGQIDRVEYQRRVNAAKAKYIGLRD